MQGRNGAEVLLYTELGLRGMERPCSQPAPAPNPGWSEARRLQMGFCRSPVLVRKPRAGSWEQQGPLLQPARQKGDVGAALPCFPQGDPPQSPTPCGR